MILAFFQEMVNHGFRTGMKLEAADLMDPRCVGCHAMMLFHGSLFLLTLATAVREQLGVRVSVCRLLIVQ